MRNQKGITLVALVVTIIVLIILAGISINLLLGDNGIITKAQEAKKQQKIAEIKELSSSLICSLRYYYWQIYCFYFISVNLIRRK